MKPKSVFLYHTLLILLLTGYTKAQTVQWAKKGISQGYEYGNAIVADDSGNVYVNGQIEYTANFDGVLLTSNGIHDIFVGKYGPDGNLKWIRSAGGSGGDVGYGIGIDSAHNCYITGEIENTANFGQGFSVTSAGSNDIVIAKYDIVGNVVWVKRFGKSSNDKGLAIAVSRGGDCYLTGSFSSSVSFGNFQLSNSGGTDIFVTKVNSGGNVVWAKKAGGNDDDRGFGIALDDSENVFVDGIFNGSASFNGTTISNNGVNGAFLAKYDSTGNFQWVRKGGACCTNTEAYCVATDKNGFIYSAGYFIGSTDFGSTHLTSNGNSDIFITKYDESGNLIWAKKAGGPNEDISYGISIDPNSQLAYITGHIEASASFDTLHVTSAGDVDVFIAAYDLNGNAFWVKNYGGTRHDVGYAVSNDGNGNVFTTGIFYTAASFGSFNLSGNLLADFYVEKTSPHPAQQPTLQASALNISSLNCYDLNVSFTPGNGSKRIVIARENAPVNVIPATGINYSGNSVFGSGTDLGNGNYVVYNDSGNYVGVTGLNHGVTYSFAVFEYNGDGTFVNYLTASPATGSAIAAPLSITINSSANSVCTGDSIFLQASGANSYSWTPASYLSSSTGSAVAASPATTTVYTVTGIDASGCLAQDTITLFINPFPIVSFLFQDTICESSTPFLLSGGLPVGGLYDGNGVNANIFYPSVSGSGIIPLQYSYTDVNGCSSSSQTTILVNASPQIFIIPLSPFCDNNAPVVLNNSSPAGGTYSGTGVIANTFDPSVGQGSYSITYTFTNGLGCSGTSGFMLDVNPSPVINLGNDLVVCADNIVLLDAGQGNSTYHWSNGALTQTIQIDSVGTGIGSLLLSSTVSNSWGCYNSDTIQVTFDLCSGINFTNENFIDASVFPNPFYNEFEIHCIQPIHLSIYDACGKLVEQSNESTGNKILGKNLSPGIYYIEFVRNNLRKTISVLKYQ